MSKPTMETLARRLDRVQWENRWWNTVLRSGACLGIIVVALCTSCARSQSAQTTPETIEWGPRYATPGVQLTLQEGSRATTPNGTTKVTYFLRVSGFPTGKTFKLWVKPFGSSPESLSDVVGEFYVDPSGKLVSQEGGDLGQISLSAPSYAKGEPYEVALISTDQTIKAFAKAIPFPIEVKEGRCRLWLELISPTGEAFALQGEGFEPNEEVTTVSRSNGEVIQGKQKVLPDGRLPANILAPAAVTRRYVASFTVIGKSCKLTVDYEWGPPALKTQ